MFTFRKDYGIYFQHNRHALGIPACVFFINILGLLVLASASLSFVRHNYLIKQVFCLILALSSCGIALLLPMEWLKKNAITFHYMALFFLILVLIPGFGLRINGSRRWLHLGIGHLQVSEYAKITYVLFLAYTLGYKKHKCARSICAVVFHIAFSAALLLLEPDYGTTALFLFVGMALLFLNGINGKFLLCCIVFALIIFTIMVIHNPVRMTRILSFMDIESTKLTGSYQLWQGLVGFNSGGLWGIGLGNGRQQLHYLPEAHTDFIFPIFAEELGYIFSLFAISAYAILFVIFWIEIYRIHCPFLFLMANGFSLFLVAQAIINLCVVMGLFPTKGIALPFMSYGGSNLIFSYFSVGILLNIFKTSYMEDLHWGETLDGELHTEP